MIASPLDLNAAVIARDGREFLFCGSSLYLFEIDALTANVIEAIRTRTPAEVVAGYAEGGGREAARQTVLELDKLCEAGILAPRGAPVAAPGEDPGIRADTVALTDLWLIVTNSCNLNCAYCFSRAEYMRDHHRMPVTTARAGIDWLIAHSGSEPELTLVLFGGEPLLNMPLLKDAVAYAHEAAARGGKRFVFSLTTNGVKLTPEIRRFLIEERFSVMISLDGEKPQQDASRPFLSGKGSFDVIVPRAKAFIREAADAGLRVNGRTTLNRTHLGRIVELYHFLDGMGFASISTPIIHAPAPCGFGFLAEDVPRLEREFDQVADLMVERSQSGKLPPWGTFTTFLDSIYQRNRPNRGCAAGRRAVCVDIAGDIYPCERFITVPEYVLGSVQDPSYDMGKVHRLSRLDQIGIYDKCRSCVALYYCKGTCAAERVRYHPPSGPDEVTCDIYRALLGAILRAYVRIDPNLLAARAARHEGAAP